MFRNSYLIHRSGKILFSKNFNGERLDPSFVVVFASSISNFCKTLVKEDVKQVSTQKGNIYLRSIGEFIILVHCDLNSAGIVQTLIQELCDLLELVFGPSNTWDSEGQVFDVSGAQDLISSFFKKTFDPFVISKGINQVLIPVEVTERIDKLLGSLESQQYICGNGTMLTLGGSVIHSRMALHETRQIVQYVKARPLNHATMRFTPVYSNGAWHALYVVRIQSYVLSILTFMDVAYQLIQPQVEFFEMSLIQSRLEIPTEESVLLLRLFAKRETLAMLYHNIKTEITIFPSLRPGPEQQQQEILAEFYNFFAESNKNLNVNGVTEYSIVKDSYRFFAMSEGVHKVYLLLSNDSLTCDASTVAADILRNIKIQTNQ